MDQCVSLTAGAPAAHARTGTEPITEAASAGSGAGSRLLLIIWRNVAIFTHFYFCFIYHRAFSVPVLLREKKKASGFEWVRQT